MKIYAIRDRLIDYYMQPFAAPSDKDVLAAISQQVNGENISAIGQAPHHFEIWQLGEVDQEGHIRQEKSLIADCSSLIRTGLRTAEERQQGIRPLGGVKIESTRPPGGDRGSPGTNPAVIPNAAPATYTEATAGGAGPRGGHGS